MGSRRSPMRAKQKAAQARTYPNPVQAMLYLPCGTNKGGTQRSCGHSHSFCECDWPQRGEVPGAKLTEATYVVKGRKPSQADLFITGGFDETDICGVCMMTRSRNGACLC